jgi:hypothetical protein
MLDSEPAQTRLPWTEEPVGVRTGERSA